MRLYVLNKKDGNLRMLCNYRRLDRMKMKDVNPLPLSEETLDQMTEARHFSKFDLARTYQQFRIRVDDRHKTVIMARYGMYEWNTLCFVLINAATAFTRLVADIFQELNGECFVLNIYNSIIYRKTEAKHLQRLENVLSIVR